VGEAGGETEGEFGCSKEAGAQQRMAEEVGHRAMHGGHIRTHVAH
jgi:hypothetical protein